MEDFEYSPVIPSKLNRKLSRIIQVKDILQRTPKKLQEPEPPKPVDNEFVFIEPRLERRSPFTTTNNWLAEFMKQRRNDRIKWNSKLHHAEERFANKSMYEQAEELMDIAAQDFADCINKLSNDEKHKISDKLIKKLFSIEIERDISHSMEVRMKVLPAVSQQIAEYANCPELFIETRIAELLKEDKKSKSAPTKLHAFGRSLSPKSRNRKIAESHEPDPFHFPGEIRSGENLFRGIDRLKSTKALVNHLERNNLQMPQYLCNMKSSNEKSNNAKAADYVPLYSMYQ